MGYRAPVEDMAFALRQLAGIDRLAGGHFENFDNELIDPILEEAGKLASDVLAPLNQTGDEQGAQLTGDGVVAPHGFAEAYRQFAEGGWMGLAAPEEWGGQGLPARMRRLHEAREAGDATVGVWGTGNAKREFLHVDDLADACLFLMDGYSEAGHVNVGTGVDLTIRELAETVRDLVHPGAELAFDSSKPDGMPRKVLDVSRLTGLGWTARTSLADGLVSTYAWFVEAAGRGELRL